MICSAGSQLLAAAIDWMGAAAALAGMGVRSFADTLQRKLIKKVKRVFELDGWYYSFAGTIW